MAELAAVEAWSEHPIAKALAGRAAGLQRAGRRRPRRPRHQRHGERHAIFPGQSRAGRAAAGERRRLPSLDGSVVYFGWDGEVRGALSFGDRVRPEAAALCADLRRRGIRTMLLSGDAARCHGRNRRPDRRR